MDHFLDHGKEDRMANGSRLVARFVSLIFLLTGFSSWATAQTKPAPPVIAVKVGDTAPDFTLRSHEGKEVRLSDFKGKKNVVLAFYVLAFTGG